MAKRTSPPKKSNRQNKNAARAKKPLEPVIDTVVMSGGAPVSPLMAGFLYALLDAGKTFKNFHTSGAGALMALLLIAPKDGKPKNALRNWAEEGVADEIYQSFPVNFKLFRKPGPFSPMFQRLAARYKVPRESDGNVIRRVLDLHAKTDANPLKERDPIRELLAEWLARPEHVGGTEADVKRRRGNALEQLYATLLNLWQGRSDEGRYAKLMQLKDPVKLFRDKWLESLFTSDDQRRVYNDLVDLWFAILTPSTLAPRSEGLAASLPFLDELVDFKKLNSKAHFNGHFCVNAYNMSKEAVQQRRWTELLRKPPERAVQPAATGENAGPQPKDAAATIAKVREILRTDQSMMDRFTRQERSEQVMEIFESHWTKEDPNRNMSQKEELGAKHIRAAFSMPFIYPPTELNESYYSEGADHQPINFHNIIAAKPPGEVVLLDVLAKLEDYLIRRPRDLWDAYIISIMTPVVALANVAIDDFKKASVPKGITLFEVPWNIPSETQPYVMDWSYSNLQTLFKLGLHAGEDFLRRRGRHLWDYRHVFPRLHLP